MGGNTEPLNGCAYPRMVRHYHLDDNEDLLHAIHVNPFQKEVKLVKLAANFRQTKQSEGVSSTRFSPA